MRVIIKSKVNLKGGEYMKKFFILIILLNFLTGMAFADDLCPMPEELKIVQPGADVPPKIANYSGIWRGKWGDAMVTQETGIAILEITPSNVKAIRCWGLRRGKKAGYQMEEGSIQGDTIILKGPSTVLKLIPTGNPDIIYAEITASVDLATRRTGMWTSRTDLKRVK